MVGGRYLRSYIQPYRGGFRVEDRVVPDIDIAAQVAVWKNRANASVQDWSLVAEPVGHGLARVTSGSRSSTSASSANGWGCGSAER
jgi:hypothetical protein